MSGRRKAVIAGGAVVGVGAVAAVTAAAMWYFGTGPQPSEALPGSTLAYVSVDIDPSGKQLLEAKKVLEKFPAWNDEEISSRKDLREALFDRVLADAPCDLEYDDDIEPWIGDRAAMALVDLGDDRAPVAVVQVTDGDKAEQAFEKFGSCGSGAEEDMGGWAISGDWAVLAETEDIAEQVAEEAEDNPLSEDDDYEKWTGEAGDPGILTVYLAPEAGDWMAEHGADFFAGRDFLPGGEDLCRLEGMDELGEPDCDDDPRSGDEVPEEVIKLFEDFDGAALTVRFDDGAIEVEAASSTDVFSTGGVPIGDSAGEVVETLPEGTAVALAYSLDEGWFDDFVDSMAAASGADLDLDDLLEQAERELGLELPEDVETLAGESAVIAVSSDVDLDAIFGSDLDVTAVPIGVKVKGDPDEIEEVIDKILEGQGADESVRELFGTDKDGDFIVVGPDADYREQMLEDGDLGDSDVYRDVVRESDDAGSILFVNFDAGGGWLEDLVQGSEELQDNVAPLEGAGISSWEDDGVAHAVLRVTTE